MKNRSINSAPTFQNAGSDATSVSSKSRKPFRCFTSRASRATFAKPKKRSAVRRAVSELERR